MATTVLVFVFSFAPMGLEARFPSRSSGCVGSTLQAAPGHRQQPRRQDTGIDAVRRWNEIAINASGLDHTPVADGETRVFGEQIGPARSSRAALILCQKPKKKTARAESTLESIGAFDKSEGISQGRKFADFTPLARRDASRLSATRKTARVWQRF
jgi:hypothetical protein